MNFPCNRLLPGRRIIDFGNEDLKPEKSTTYEIGLYYILKGEGQYQVDGDIFPVKEGSIVRVSPDGKRALKNTGTGEMLMLCVQYKANSFGKSDDISEDGTILTDPLVW